VGEEKSPYFLSTTGFYMKNRYVKGAKSEPQCKIESKKMDASKKTARKSEYNI
jgi:hypothetical protein